MTPVVPVSLSSLYMSLWEFWIFSFHQWSVNNKKETSDATKYQLFWNISYLRTWNKWNDIGCGIFTTSFPLVRTTIEPNLKLLIDGCAMDLNHDAFQATVQVFHCWQGVTFIDFQGWISSFKSTQPYSTCLPSEAGTLVWMLASCGHKTNRVCTKWHFHDTKLMEWVSLLGLPLIPIRQSSRVRKLTQLAW